jgi:hypothetical protein
MITKDTILKQGDKEYPAVEVEGVVYWVDENLKGEIGWNFNYGLDRLDNLPSYYPEHSTEWNCCKKIIAQSKPILEGVPVISREVNPVVVYQTHLRAFLQGVTHSHKEISDNAINRFRTWFSQQPELQAAQSDKKWTDEDMRMAIQFGLDGMYGYKLDDEGYTINQMNRYLASIQSIIKVIEVDDQFRTLKIIT